MRHTSLIHEEARAIEEGRLDRKNNPLKNAPHTVEDLVGEWNRPYSREAPSIDLYVKAAE
jgi:glycine dehydrogenase